MALGVLLALGVVSSAFPARANERHFTRTYESGVLPAGAKELEVWSTMRLGRKEYYARFDHRLEFEMGVTNRLMTAFYINFTATSADDAMGARQSAFEYKGLSSEWKLKLLDPVADALGLALYGEVTVAPDEVELEEKLILDKQIGNVLLAGNLVFEQEIEIGQEMPGGETEAEVEHIIELDLAVSYRLGNHFALGLEVVNHNEIAHGEYEHSALYLGPVMSYATDSWWLAFSVLPQLPALYNHDKAAGSGPDLLHHERISARLLFAFHL